MPKETEIVSDSTRYLAEALLVRVQGTLAITETGKFKVADRITEMAYRLG